MGLGIGIEDWIWDLGIMIGDLGLGFRLGSGIGDWGLGIGIRDCNWVLGIRIGNWDWG